jgi:hypothetical protein
LTQKKSKIEHEEARGIWTSAAAETAPLDVRQEQELVRWARSLHVISLRLAAAGVLRSLGSLNKAASLLYGAGYQVPNGYFPDDHEGARYEPYEEEALQLLVEEEAERIEAAASSVGFYLAAKGELLDPVEGALQE